MTPSEKRLCRLREERAQLEKNLLPLKPMLAGSLVERFISCGKPDCACAKRAKMHGPYYYLSWREDGRSRQIYLGGPDDPRIGRAKAYGEFQRTVARLNCIQRELVEMLWALAEKRMHQPGA